MNDPTANRGVMPAITALGADTVHLNAPLNFNLDNDNPLRVATDPARPNDFTTLVANYPHYNDDFTLDDDGAGMGRLQVGRDTNIKTHILYQANRTYFTFLGPSATYTTHVLSTAAAKTIVDPGTESLQVLGTTQPLEIDQGSGSQISLGNGGSMQALAGPISIVLRNSAAAPIKFDDSSDTTARTATIGRLAADDWTVTGMSPLPISISGSTKFVASLVSGSTASTLVGPDVRNSWDIVGANSTFLDGVIQTSFPNLTGGSDRDAFIFNSSSFTSGSISGNIDGGPGIDGVFYAPGLLGPSDVIDLPHHIAPRVAGQALNIESSDTYVFMTVNNPGPVSAQAGEPMSPITITATDGHGSQVFSATGLPNGVTIDSQSGVISGTPTGAAGSVTITAYVTDDFGTGSTSFQFTILPGLSLNPVAIQTSAINALVSLQPSANNPFGTTLTFSATGLPPNLSIDSQSGLISGTIAAGADAGSPYTVHVTAADGTHTTSTSFTWQVIASSAITTVTTIKTDHASGATYGDLIHFTVTVTAASGAPMGTVQFQVDHHNIGQPQTLTGGMAALDVSDLAAVDHAIEALFTSNDASFANSQDELQQHVDKARLTITAENKTKDYGAPLPALTVSYAGFVNSETFAVLTTAAAIATTATTASHVGGYPITASGAAASNYEISYVPGTLQVNPVALVITADDKSKLYGAALPSLTVSYAGFVNGDSASSLTTPPTTSTTAKSSSSVSTYPITASGALDADYTISYKLGSLSVTTASLTIKADDKSKIAGAANPPLTFTAAGFVNGDTAASLTTQPVVSTTATANSPPGQYPITVSGATGNNYTIHYVSGTLNVMATAGASITGKVYLDITGNGISTDDGPLSASLVFIDANNNGSWNSGEPITTSLSDGTFAFTGLPAGTYKLRQVLPASYVRTAPVTSDVITVKLSANQTSSGNNFADTPTGNRSVISNVVFVINGVTPVTDLHGHVNEGDVIQVSFTVASGAAAQPFTLVSYTAAAPISNSSTASLQHIFASDTGLLGPGMHSLTISVPHSFFEVDFVAGYAIDHLGPAGSNIFYASQNRLISNDHGGTHAVLNMGGSLTGYVYADANNNGVFESTERPISGVTVTLKGGSLSQTVVTDIHGAYRFDNLPPGIYNIAETQPASFSDGVDTLGSRGGAKGNDKFSGILLPAGTSGAGYNFGERQTVGQPFTSNQRQSTAWWASASGQALLKSLNGGSSAKNLGNWLGANYGNLFGLSAGLQNNLSGKTNAQVATYLQSLASNAVRQVETEFLALALSDYVSDSRLAGNVANRYGFAISSGGLGIATANIATFGTSLGTADNAVLTISEILSRIASRSHRGLVWDADGTGSLSSAETIVRNSASMLLRSINNG
jgi:hypothetical protein